MSTLARNNSAEGHKLSCITLPVCRRFVDVTLSAELNICGPDVAPSSRHVFVSSVCQLIIIVALTGSTDMQSICALQFVANDLSFPRFSCYDQ